MNGLSSISLQHDPEKGVLTKTVRTATPNNRQTGAYPQQKALQQEHPHNVATPFRFQTFLPATRAPREECVHQDTDESKTVCTAAVSGVVVVRNCLQGLGKLGGPYLTFDLGPPNIGLRFPLTASVF